MFWAMQANKQGKRMVLRKSKDLKFGRDACFLKRMSFPVIRLPLRKINSMTLLSARDRVDKIK